MPCGTRTGGRVGLLEHYVVDVGWAAVVLAGARGCRDRAGGATFGGGPDVGRNQASGRSQMMPGEPGSRAHLAIPKSSGDDW